jgi:proline racemase
LIAVLIFWAIDVGNVPVGGDGTIEFDLEAPAGIVPIRAKCHDGKVKNVTLRNVPSFVRYKDIVVSVPEIGDVVVDVVYSGMWYCVVRTRNVPVQQGCTMALRPENGKDLCRVGEMIKCACREQYPVNHPHVDYPGCDIMVFRGEADEVTVQGAPPLCTFSLHI